MLALVGCGGKQSPAPATSESAAPETEQVAAKGPVEAPLETPTATSASEETVQEQEQCESSGEAVADEECAAEEPTVTSTAQETEWVCLFNGTDLTGWRNARDPSGEVTWTIEDGAMTNQEHGHDIATVDFFKDFDLRLEYKTVPKGNSGVYLRGRIELQVLDSYDEPEVGTGSDGAVYGQFPPLVKASKPAGEWNTLEATLVGNRLTAKLNGQVIHENREITEVTGGALPGGVEDPGPLMLQGDHGKVWYRNIEIRPITSRMAE